MTYFRYFSQIVVWIIHTETLQVWLGYRGMTSEYFDLYLISLDFSLKSVTMLSFFNLSYNVVKFIHQQWLLPQINVIVLYSLCINSRSKTNKVKAGFNLRENADNEKFLLEKLVESFMWNLNCEFFGLATDFILSSENTYSRDS